MKLSKKDFIFIEVKHAPVILNLKASCEIARTKHPHGDGQLLAVATYTRSYARGGVVRAVGARGTVAGSLHRLHRFPPDCQWPATHNQMHYSIFLVNR